jgi:hypothetical protein
MIRLVYVAQKYNPVRATTAEGTVGLGGPLTVSEFKRLMSPDFQYTHSPLQEATRYTAEHCRLGM